MYFHHSNAIYIHTTSCEKKFDTELNITKTIHKGKIKILNFASCYIGNSKYVKKFHLSSDKSVIHQNCLRLNVSFQNSEQSMRDK